MKKNDKNIENDMIKWRDENDGMEDDGRIRKIEKLGNYQNRAKIRDSVKKKEQIKNIKSEIGFILSME